MKGLRISLTAAAVAVFLVLLAMPASAELRREDTYEFTGPLVWSISLSGGSVHGSVHIIVDDATGEILEVKDFR